MRLQRLCTRFNVASGLLFALCWAYVLLVPFTKVEESFSLHAVHDLLLYGPAGDTAKFDHFEHLSPVPRSFVGPLVLAGATWPVQQMWKLLSPRFTLFHTQMIVRLVLATINASSLLYLARSIPRKTATLFVLLTAFQFHIPYYAGRTLPNMLAFPLVQVALAKLLFSSPSQRIAGFTILATTAAVLRAELVALLIPVAVQHLLSGHSFSQLAIAACFTIILLAASTAIDGHFWKQPSWPELDGVLFNVLEGKSSDWGTSPVHHYFTSALPKLLLLCYPLLGISVITNRTALLLSAAPLVSIVILSQLGHKEWRFIIYTLPVLIIAALHGLLSWRISTTVKRLVLLAIFSSALAHTLFSTFISYHNYPGGNAMSALHDVIAQNHATPNERKLQVHVDAYSAMTGASLFTQTSRESIIYNRNESITDFAPFDYLVVHDHLDSGDFDVAASVSGYAGMGRRMIMGKLPLPTPRFEEQVWVMKNRAGVP